MPMDDRPNHGGGSRKWIIQEVENSLRRLKTDYVDLYQVHRPSPTTDVEETLGALTDLVHQGKIRYIGSSSRCTKDLGQGLSTGRICSCQSDAGSSARSSRLRRSSW
jgi:aryl-alcohol dehydrogenase-like predicted oxidoreductase